jgi:hypothetical protein
MYNELTFRRTSMVRLKRLAASAVLSAVIANPAFAQAVIQESGAYAKNYATADLAIGAPLSSRMAINETSKSTVWPAPVGHHQPRVADIPSYVSTRNTLLSLDQEDTRVDRKIGGICRGC